MGRTDRTRLLEVGYAVALVAGIALPYAQAVPWLLDHGPDLPRLFDEVFGDRISAFFGWDVVVSVLALAVATAVDGSLRRGQKALILAGSLLGASVGLPLYLLLRQRNRSRPTANRYRPDDAPGR
ncbi:DUF2834 domain-containing protein [Longispora sp. NPDC051575]|uniref:DUF2834 domain-containing protein n=1 Tax=Longispora sp. NPDC051575 TaxID=3154943 RepID=UPI0034185163